MEKQYKLTDRVSKDSLKSPTFKKWLKRVICLVCILSLVLQLTLCCIPMLASAEDGVSIVGTWILNPTLSIDSLSSSINLSSGDVQSYAYFGGNLVLTDVVSISYSTSFNPTRYQILVSFGSTTFANRLYSNSSYGAGLSEDYVQAVNGSASPATTLYLKDSDNGLLCRTLIVNDDSSFSAAHKSWLITNATKVVTSVYDFTGEYRLFNEQLTNLSFAQSGTVTQTYQFDYQIWNGYSADYFTVQASGRQVDISYAFTDEGSGGVTTVYRQLLRDGNIVGTWLVPRARLIYFESNPDDTTLQKWLLDNTTLVDESMLQTVYDFGYNNGFNDGWTDNLIGDTLNAPIQALNNITLLQVGNTVISLGGVIFTMIVLCILIVFLKKFAGG